MVALAVDFRESLSTSFLRLCGTGKENKGKWQESPHEADLKVAD
jgi:hypothetical protein